MMKILFLLAAAAALLLGFRRRARAEADPCPVPEDLMRLSDPDWETDDRALAAVLRRAEAGENLTVALIGGSITMGTVSVGSEDEAYPDRKPYAALFFDWWQTTFPRCRFTFVNAGIGGTDSYLGVHRVVKDVLEKAPDLVLVEFSVNDDGSEFCRYSYDSLVRTLLKAPSAPAVMLLFMGQTDGTCAQAAHRTVGRGYKLPSVSCADVFQAMIRGGIRSAAALSGDTVHPSALGHRVTAALLIRCLERVRAKCAALPDPAPFALPPVTGERYPACHIENSLNAAVTDCGGFRKGSDSEFYRYGWTCPEADGRGISVVTDCARLGILYLKTVDGKSGRAEVLVDGVRAAVLDADFTGGWGNAVTAREVLAADRTERREVTVRPLDGQFILLGLLVTVIPG